jgi:AhpD family alkylhydroperoxidase
VVQITAARVRGCDFCVAGHSAIALKKAAFSAAVVQALHEGHATGEARTDAIARFTRAVIASRGNVSDAEWDAFRGAGLGEQAALEIVLGVSLATLCNFANNLARNLINPELSASLQAQCGEDGPSVSAELNVSRGVAASRSGAAVRASRRVGASASRCRNVRHVMRTR